MSSASVIGQGTFVRGSIRGDGDVEILGRVEGSVVVNGEVTIGEGALVKSDVRARRVIVRGSVAGNVSADELLILESGARVAGDLGAPQIGIRPGGLVKGHVSTAGPLPLERPKAAPAAASRATPARPAQPAARPAPAAIARPAAPAARPAVAPRIVAAPRIEHEVAIPRPAPSRPVAAAAPPPAPEPEPEIQAEPPPPVVPAMPKGARAPARGKKAGK